MEGFIKLYRSVQRHWIYDEKRKFSKYEAWLDILMMASHKDNKFVLGNELIELEKGQFVTSIRKLSERWDWSNTKVNQFLELLVKDKMLEIKKDTKKTLLTVVNYGFYHDYENTKTSQTDCENVTKTSQKHTIKNVKNVKNGNNTKKHYAEFVTLTEEEHEKLTLEFGEQGTKERIDKLNSYKGSKGKKYKSDYHTILTWERKNKPIQQNTQQIPVRRKMNGLGDD